MLKTYFSMSQEKKRLVPLFLHKFSFYGLQFQSQGSRLPSQERLASLTRGPRC